MIHNLRLLREKNRMSRSKLAELADTSERMIEYLEKGQRQLTPKWINIFSPILSVEPEDFFSTAPTLRKIAVIGKASASFWAEPWEFPQDEKYAISIPHDMQFQNISLFAVEVEGDSMNTIYPEGSIVVIAPLSDGAKPIVGKKYLVRREIGTNYEVTLKELAKHNDELWLIPHSTNPLHRPFKLIGDADSTITILGRVVYSVRKED